MKHYGDITKICGAVVEPVDVIIGGSPCQDLSIAGKRAGLAGERSGLFMEQIRVIKEMRCADEARGRTGADVRPRYMVWENVPGAFSSNKGEDFGAVLQETVRIVAPEAPAIPVPRNGWPLAGCIEGQGGVWSVAWRVLDAQFWGVPQRRRRIALVADFGGGRAPEILFERQSVPWDYPACGSATEGAPHDASRGVTFSDQDVAGGSLTCYPDKARALTARHDSSPCLDRGQNFVVFAQNQRDEVRDLKGVAGALAANAGIKQQTYVALTNRGAVSGDVTETLRAESHGAIPMVYAAGFKAGQSEKARSIGYADEQAPTLSSNVCGLEPTVFCIQGNSIDRADTAGCNGKGWIEDLSYTLNTVDRPAVVYDARGNGNGWVAPTLTGDHQSRITDYTTVAVESYFSRQSNSEYVESPVASAQLARQHKDVSDVVVAQKVENVSAFDCRNLAECPELSATLQAKAGGGHSLNYQNPVFYEAPSGIKKFLRYIVRRLIPLECERLQGFPDGWTDIGPWVDTKGKRHKESTDSQRYKALGNSIAIPPWSYVLQKLALCCGAGATMASLFDGIGGFPLIWERLNGKGSCLWASEIDKFAIAVTRRHFPE